MYGLMPTSVTKIKNNKKEKSMDRPIEPIHGCSIRACMPPLVRATERWCGLIDLSLEGTSPLDLLSKDFNMPDLCHGWRRGGASLLLTCERRGKSEEVKRGRWGTTSTSSCHRDDLPL
jgi:hypothetical protein